MYKKTQLLLAIFLIGASGQAMAKKDFHLCSEFFAGGKPPMLKLSDAWKLQPLCLSSFAILHSGATKTPLLTAERLTRAQLLDAKSEKRTNRFYAEARLPLSHRAQLNDYENNELDMDRGHLVPAANMPDQDSMAQSFSLANIVPQNRVNNRRSWAAIEKATRKYVMRAEGSVYVVTGVVFQDPVVTIGTGRVHVPSHLYKLVYDEAARRAWAHWIKNDSEAKVGMPISHSELVSRIGFNPIPGLIVGNDAE